MASQENKDCRPCGPCQNYKTTLEGIHLRMNRLIDRDDALSPSILKELKREGQNAQYVLGLLHAPTSAMEDARERPALGLALGAQLVVRTVQDPPEAGRGCDCKNASQGGRFPSGEAFGIGRAGFWVMKTAQESEPEGAGGRATHRYKLRSPSGLPLLSESSQDFSTAKVNRPLPPLMLHRFSDAEEEEIEKVE